MGRKLRVVIGPSKGNGLELSSHHKKHEAGKTAPLSNDMKPAPYARLCLVLPLIFVTAGSAAPRVISTRYPTDDFVVASIVATDPPYALKPDAVTDCTAALQSAIDTAAAQGGGVVFIPAGRYRFDGDLVVKEGVTLRGDWKPPGTLATVGGTILMPYGGRGQTDGDPFLAVQRGSGVRDLSIWYPDQDAANPVPYPWTIADDQNHAGDNYTVHQVTLVNSYQGINFGPKYNELFTVRQVYGTPLKTGLQFDSVTDIGRVEGLHFGPRYWVESGLGTAPDSAALSKTLFASGTAIEMRRSDWQYFYDVDVEGYSRGLYIRRGEHGGSIGVAYDFRATGCDTALLVEETRFVATNCHFQGASAAVHATDQFSDDLQFNACNLEATAGPALQTDGTGAVRLVNTRLTGQGPAVVATQGRISLLNCDLPGRGIQFEAAKPVERVLLAGNRWGEPARATEIASRGDVQVDAAPLDLPRLQPPDIALSPDPKPNTDQLFNVVDFGARPELCSGRFDNTAAFQTALNAAGAAGGGTVYVPGGFYRFHGHLLVPAGVELRGVFDVPHHTISAGSVLMPTEGRGQEDGTPFLSLTSGSGLRGLTIWYPEQFVDQITPYPWTVRSLGPKCWMTDVTSANSYDFVDFGSHPSDGHLLRYVAGSPLRHGIWVSKGSGEVDCCQFNPHYWVRKSASEPPLSQDPNAKDLGGTLMDFILQNHEAYVFGSCPHEVQVNNFVFGDSYGLRFVDDNGATGGWVINHASDGSSEGVRVDAAAPEGLNIVSTQIAVVGAYKRRSLEVGPTNRGPVNIIGGYSFGQSDVPTMELYGSGPTLVQSWQSKQSAILAAGGPKHIESVAFSRDLPVTVQLSQPVASLELSGNTGGRESGFAYAPMQKGVFVRCDGHPLPLVPLNARFDSNFGQNSPSAAIRPVTLTGVTNAACRIEPGAGRQGAALVLTGVPDAGAHAIEYYAVYDVNLTVRPDTILRYWLRSETPSGSHTGVDLIFTDGTTLRDSGTSDSSGGSMHPAADKGEVGPWWEIEGKLGTKLTGKTIKTVLFAYDQGDAKTPVRADVDRIEIGEPVE